MINFILGVFIGCTIAIITIALCKASGRADLEAEIFNLELENKAATNKIEELMGKVNIEITSPKLTKEQKAHIAKKVKDWKREMAIKRKAKK